MNSVCDRLLLKMCSWNWQKLIFFNINIRNKLMIGISWFVSHEVCIHGQYFFGVVRNKLKLLLESKKRRSKVQEKNMSCERALYFDQWKTFSENYKPMRVWFWLVYKFTENYRRSWLFSEFIQTQKRYPTSWQNAYPNLKTTWHVKLTFFLWTKLESLLPRAKYLIYLTTKIPHKL